MENAKAAELAEKIAKLIASESKAGDLSSIQKSIEALNVRLDKLESASLISHSALLAPHSVHPSQDRFAIAEAEKAYALMESGEPHLAILLSARGPLSMPWTMLAGL